ncbi:ribosome biogenesis GTP-binding protein YihA/YsxC [Polluticaenibacter yanchengensis]|uniref:Probable GTP-binding protein EngB n=1 Tax=Polluticaenibacter yanchengensis TaxID=3014562 RepID=A0ABT4ULD2_9BACT|nr:ribosome biogenesis GTP-binding protein YihA/YsxC [Chitinophagaceae bacterium LY-5]
MEITKAAYLLSSPSFDKCPKPDRGEFAFIGRSNVGKSSLINMLCNNASLAKTSASPGKTQMINHFEIVSKSKKVKEPFKWFLVDLPGYGYAKVSQSSRRKWEQMIEGYLRKRENLVSVFVLVDARHQPQKIDLEFMQQLGDWEVPFAVIFTKADKEKPGVVKRNVEAMTELMREHWQFLPPFFVTSSTKKDGKQDVLEYLERCLTEEPEN